MATGNKVKFAYVGTGRPSPAYPDPDTVYFLEEAKEIRVGSQLFANVDMNAVDMETLMSILEAYTVKSLEITGSGNNVEDISFNTANGKITVTKGNLPVLSKGVSPASPTVQLDAGDTFEVMTDTAVNGHIITDDRTKFKLPKQISTLEVSSSGSTLNFRLVFSDGTSTEVTYEGLGTAAFTSASDYATAAQGLLAENAMPASNGVATDARVSLAADPVGPMDAATKGYVDAAIEGAASNLNFLGTSTTEVTEGGTEAPTVDGVVIPVADLHKGDWVIYDGNQYIWDGNAWAVYGSKGDVPKERQILAGPGLTGGGNLAADRTISHATLYPEAHNDEFSGLNVIGAISYDVFGHITGITTKDLTTGIESVIQPYVQDLSDLADRVSTLEGNVTDLGTAVNLLSGEIDAINENITNNYYTSIQTDDAIDAAIAAQVPGMIDDAFDQRVATNDEFNEMLTDVFGPAA